ncbi:hypothetical protein VTN77DRAFT_7517 [Rasamsonia byssochlamydoides]|uniref:uncharacterized protein n=1 Tax=Rasamsonia byssochlamydoides TaxID=89139 RepID=UPI0037448A84
MPKTVMCLAFGNFCSESRPRSSIVILRAIRLSIWLLVTVTKQHVVCCSMLVQTLTFDVLLLQDMYCILITTRA